MRQISAFAYLGDSYRLNLNIIVAVCWTPLSSSPLLHLVSFSKRDELNAVIRDCTQIGSFPI